VADQRGVLMAEGLLEKSRILENLAIARGIVAGLETDLRRVDLALNRLAPQHIAEPTLEIQAPPLTLCTLPAQSLQKHG
jgi:hypothetical protein